MFLGSTVMRPKIRRILPLRLWPDLRISDWYRLRLVRLQMVPPAHWQRLRMGVGTAQQRQGFRHWCRNWQLCWCRRLELESLQRRAATTSEWSLPSQRRLSCNWTRCCARQRELPELQGWWRWTSIWRGEGLMQYLVVIIYWVMFRLFGRPSSEVSPARRRCHNRRGLNLYTIMINFSKVFLRKPETC